MANENNKLCEAAKNMIRRYGDDAVMEVDQRIRELESRGHKEAVALWKLIREQLVMIRGGSSGETRH